MRLLFTLLLLACPVLSSSVLRSQDSQTTQSIARPLTNADVLDMLGAGLSQEIVIAKIAASACEFDTSSAALKALKTANVADAVILAMVQVPDRSREQALTNAERSAPARIDCKHTRPVSVYSAPWTHYSDSVEVFTVKCGDTVTLLNPGDKKGWLRIRTVNNQLGYISFGLVTAVRSEEASRQARSSSEEKRHEDIQRAGDDFEDCKVRSQNEYDTKMSAIGTMALSPMVRVAASRRLKENLDAEVRQCRSQYELRLKTIDGE